MAVQVRGLKKSFSHKVSGSGLKGFFSPEMRMVEAVKGIDLEIEDGELLAFIGPNGAGKSTTIKLITGILYPDEGEISVLGLDPHKKRRELAYSIGSVFGQKSQLWYHLPPIDSLRLLASIYGLADRAAADRIDYLAEVLEIGEYLNQPVRKLSLGQRIRCEIAGSLIHSPRIIFLDEPTIGLDLVAKQKLRYLIRQVNRDEGRDGVPDQPRRGGYREHLPKGGDHQRGEHGVGRKNHRSEVPPAGQAGTQPQARTFGGYRPARRPDHQEEGRGAEAGSGHH
jgi:ABC-2 type transport system ATP-binding protein